MKTKNTFKTIALIVILFALIFLGSGNVFAQSSAVGWQCTSDAGIPINNICYPDQSSCQANCAVIGPAAGCRQTSCNIPTPLTVTCTPNKTTIFVGANVTWNSNVSGGTGNRQFEWNGTDNLLSSTSSATITYTTTGIKTASVTVTSGTEQVTVNCTSSVEVLSPALTGFCAVSVNIRPEDYTVTWRAGVRTFGFIEPVEPVFLWTDPDNLTETNQSIDRTYASTSPAVKSASVDIQAGNQSLPLTCSADPSGSLPLPSNGFFGGSCTPSANGMEVTWTANAFGGIVGNTSTTTYSWSGDDGFATTSRTARITYGTEGTKSARVVINSGNQSIALACQARVASTTAVSGSGCFIATAAFGTSLEPEVMVLRHFRDETLLSNTLGQVFVEEYYKISPPIADFIRDKETLKAAVRFGLSPIIYTLDHLGYSS